MKALKASCAVASITLCLAGTGFAQDGDAPAQEGNAMADVVIETQDLGDGIYMLTGRGGNIGLSIGDDATFIIDDQFAPLTDRIVEAVAELTDQPVEYVLNTHWHFDHTGGNENFGRRGAVIVAHDNVRNRMAVGQRIEAFNVDVPPAPAVALPEITFDASLTLHLNGHTIMGLHVPSAHTDGDTIVYFAEANVVHMGDVFFHTLYPFIDIDSGGSIQGIIDAVSMALGMINDNTRIIPGHGPLATQADLQAYHDLLVEVRDSVQALLDEGMSIDEVVAAAPTAALDASANRNGFLTPAQFVTAVATSLAGE